MVLEPGWWISMPELRALAVASMWFLHRTTVRNLRLWWQHKPSEADHHLGIIAEDFSVLFFSLKEV